MSTDCKNTHCAADPDRDPDQFFAITPLNGIWVCTGCHRKSHDAPDHDAPDPYDVAGAQEFARLLHLIAAMVEEEAERPSLNTRTLVELACMNIGSMNTEKGRSDVGRWVSNGVDNQKKRSQDER